MPLRLSDRFAVGDRVEIYLAQNATWTAGVILAFSPPGVWVRTGRGRDWFVTNGRRIRGLDGRGDDPAGERPDGSSAAD